MRIVHSVTSDEKNTSSNMTEPIDEHGDDEPKEVLRCISVGTKQTVVITTGVDEVQIRWKVPVKLLRRHSSLFQKLCDEESPPDSLRLPHIDAGAFELFMEWSVLGEFKEGRLWTNIAGSEATHLSNEVRRDDAVSWEEKACVWAWVLGEQLGAPAFQNYAMRKLFGTMVPVCLLDWYLHAELAIYACKKHTGRHNKLREFFFSEIIRNWGDDQIDETDPIWDKLFNAEPEFCWKFIQQMGEPLEFRRKKAPTINKFLVSEE